MKKRRLLLFIILIVLIIFSVFVFTVKKDNKDEKIVINNDVVNSEKIKEEYDYSNIIDTYKDKYNNNEVVAVLNILNTDFSHVIMQHNDNSYYLNHSEDNKSYYLGSLFADYRININNSKKILIFGHNSKYIDVPFKTLENYYDINYFKEHQYMELITSEEKKLYQIFSIFIETSDYSYMQLEYNNTDSWYSHLLSLKEKSIYDTSVNVNKDDEIMILQTCSNHDDYKNYSHKYLLIILRRIKNEEKIY